jgi:hypothetical protein
VSKIRDWSWHVYSSKDGSWVGQFKTEDIAREWLSKHPGYVLSNEKPVREPKVKG